ncbi:hypothetical protein [Salinicoccus sp. HZC-1]|uniref:hypothetical protein n=1 Tax=Salinicoccus sp. HZC-1 TaxID=3385497 RepID=UPI00398B0D72
MKQFTGLSFLSILLLAFLGVPRVIGHDLGWLNEGTFINALFVFIPVIIWVSIAVLKKEMHPFRSMLVLGAFHGVLLAAAHQILWGAAFPMPPELGGNFVNAPGYFKILIPRSAAVLSSIMTGIIMGTVLGLAALVIKKLLK